MVDVVTTNLKLTEPSVGGDNNTWGALLNADLGIIDAKLGNKTAISTTGGTTNLTDTQELVAAIVVSGALVSDALIVFSGRGGIWLINNLTTGAFNVKVQDDVATPVTIPAGISLIWGDGT